MLFGITQNPLFDISDEDAEKITQRAANVARHYENIPGVSQKTKDWILFMQAMGAIYTPRFVAWRMEVASKRAKPQARPSPLAPANVAPSVTQPNVQQPPPAARSDLPRNQPMPSANDRTQFTTPPPPPPGQPSAAPRHQPGLETLDGAELLLKPN